jgi:superfamily II DNA or RNA helicase
MLFDLFRTLLGRGLVGFDPVTASRGEAVFRAGRVLSLREEAAGRLAGEVEGSRGETYRTTLTLVSNGAVTSATSRCSCPVGAHCKHGVALLLAWLHDRRDGVASVAAPAAWARGAIAQADSAAAPFGSPVDATAGTHGVDDADGADDGRRAEVAASSPERVLDRPWTTSAAATTSTAPPAFDRLRVLEWVRELRVLKLPDSAPDAAPDLALCYVLRNDLRRPALQVFRVRGDAADGTVVEPEPYRGLAVHAHAPLSFWDECDAQVAMLLASQSTNSGEMPLDGPRAHEALLRIAGAGKLFLDRPPGRGGDAPLTLGEPRAASIAWGTVHRPARSEMPGDGAADATKTDDAASIRLGLKPDPDAEVVYTARPCWIDRAARRFGAISAPPPAALVLWVRNAPTVAADAADEVALALHAHLRARPALRDAIPPLAGGPVRERLGVPRPVIGLFSIRPGAAPRGGGRPATPGRDMLAVSYAVEYEGRRIEPLRAASLGVRDDAGPVLLTCDPAAERAALDGLRDALRELARIEDGIAFAADTAGDPDKRSRGGSGWLTVATLPASTVAAARVKHELARRLAEEGWGIVDESELPLDVVEPDAVSLDLRPAGTGPKGESGAGWFELQSGIQVAGRRIDLAPVLAEVISRGGLDAWSREQATRGVVWLRVSEREVLRIDAARIEPLLRVVTDWAEVSAVGDEPPVVRIDAMSAAALAALSPDLPIPGSLAALRELSTSFEGLAPVDPPPSFLATLRPYQRHGLAWLQFVAASGTGGVLADDMGLGKTVQVLAHLECERAAGRLVHPTLVVAPTSLVFNWQDEAARHAPGLRVLALTGSTRASRFGDIADHDIVLTSYALLPRDLAAFVDRRWHMLIADEAHLIKNSRTRAAAAIHALQAGHRIALTGTPLENHLGELWSVMQFAVPGLLGREEVFRSRFRIPIERRPGTPEAIEQLQALERRIRPFLLRRTKSSVLDDLPPRTDIVHRVDLGREQRDLYESLRVAMDERVRHALSRTGLERSRIVVLDALLKLRQACCDPSLLKLPAARRVASSAKLETLLALLATLVDEGRKVLVFSQFTSMLDRIEVAIDADGPLSRITRTRLDGDTDDRRGVVEAFQQGDAQIFLLSLKAGGVGLNLTAADTVIHYDPWWNPAVEAQATDRAHRIGQVKPVFVYKLIAAGTIEERILALQARKAGLAQAVLAGGQAGDGLSREDLLELFEPGA